MNNRSSQSLLLMYALAMLAGDCGGMPPTYYAEKLECEKESEKGREHRLKLAEEKRLRKLKKKELQ